MSRGDTFTSTLASYESWRARRIQIIDEEVAVKAERLRESPFVLFRGTPFRFHRRFAELLPSLARAPVAVSVGDLHIENFGTWRDRDARLVWGADALDEVDVLPYPLDLVRLAASAVLAIEAGLLAVNPADACTAIEAGWRERIHARGLRSFVIGEEHAHLYATLVREAVLDPVEFSRWVSALPAYERALPKPATRMLAAVTPPGDFRPQFRRRVTGVAGLGARRIVAVGELDGGLVVREAKQVPGPVSMWAEPKRSQIGGLVGAIDAARGIAADPNRRQSRKWIVKPLGPDSTRLDLLANGPRHVDLEVLHAMGAEAANVHLVAVSGAAPVKALRRDEASRGEGWLLPAAVLVAEAARADHAGWCNS